MHILARIRRLAHHSQLAPFRSPRHIIRPLYYSGQQIRTLTADVGVSDAESSPVLRYPDPPSKEHYDVSSYLAYAKRIGLDSTTTTFVGTQYEYTVAATLKQHGFDLRRVGGAGDFGIDLLGLWSVPSTHAALRVILQCKASSTTSKTRIGPATIRELEGAFVGAPPGWRGGGVLGFLVTQRAATKGIRDALSRSQWPIGFISCSSEGHIQQLIWNSKAEEDGLAGMGVGVRLSETSSNQELVLSWKGQPAFKSREPTKSTPDT